MPRFDAAASLALIERHGVTSTHVVPTMMKRWLDLDDDVRGRVRRQLDALADPRRGAVPAGRQAADHRVVRARRVRVLLLDRGRRYVDHGRRLAAPPRLGRVGRGRAPTCASSTTTATTSAPGTRRADLPAQHAGRSSTTTTRQDGRQPARRLRHGRRPRLARRRRLPLPRRPAHRPHPVRRRERLPGRDRGRAAWPTRASPTRPSIGVPDADLGEVVHAVVEPASDAGDGLVAALHAHCATPARRVQAAAHDRAARPRCRAARPASCCAACCATSSPPGSVPRHRRHLAAPDRVRGGTTATVNERSMRPASGSSARALLLTILGELVLPHGGARGRRRWLVHWQRSTSTSATRVRPSLVSPSAARFARRSTAARHAGTSRTAAAGC